MTDSRFGRILPVFSFALLLCAHLASAQTAARWSALDEGQRLASKDGKIVFVFVEAEWCGICKRMKREVFPKEEVARLMDRRFVPVSIDLDSNREVRFNGQTYTERSLAQSMAVRSTPTMLFVDPDGEILGSASGYLDAVRFRALLSYIDSDAFRHVSFDKYLKRLESGS